MENRLLTQIWQKSTLYQHLDCQVLYMLYLLFSAQLTGHCKQIAIIQDQHHDKMCIRLYKQPQLYIQSWGELEITTLFRLISIRSSLQYTKWSMECIRMESPTTHYQTGKYYSNIFQFRTNLFLEYSLQQSTVLSVATDILHSILNMQDILMEFNAIIKLLCYKISYSMYYKIKFCQFF